MILQNIDADTLRRILTTMPHPGQPADGACQLTSVFLLLCGRPSSILMIQKADTEGYPWRNQMALPGGHIDPCDATSLEAGFRELYEELNISRNQVTYVGTLGVDCRY